MQLSTRERDYIVDPLQLRGDMGRLLPIFSDPGIVKVRKAVVAEQEGGATEQAGGARSRSVGLSVFRAFLFNMYVL